jgi:magnesium-transporting ATPase (P-type)
VGSAPSFEIDRYAALSGADALKALSGEREGLSAAEATARTERYGLNELGQAGRTWLSILAAQLKSPLLGLLVVAAAVSIAVGERVDGGIILGIMALSVGLAFVNESRSERTLALLREQTGCRATVLRETPYACQA